MPHRYIISYVDGITATSRRPPSHGIDWILVTLRVSNKELGGFSNFEMTLHRLTRVLLAGSIAALVPAVAFVLFTRSIPIALIAYFYALALGTFVGLPLFIIAQFWLKTSGFSTAIIGFITGALPVAILRWPLRFSVLQPNQNVDGVITMINGVPTFMGWLHFVKGMLPLGALGALAGIVFFFMLRGLGDPLSPGLSSVTTLNSSAEDDAT